MGQKMIPLLSVRKIRHAQPRPAQRTCVRAGGRLHSIVLLRDVMRLGPGGHMWKKRMECDMCDSTPLYLCKI